MQKQLQFFSVASDGRVTLWTLEKSELTHQVDGWLSQQMQGLVQHMDTPVEAAEAQAHQPGHGFSSSVQQVQLCWHSSCWYTLGHACGRWRRAYSTEWAELTQSGQLVTRAQPCAEHCLPKRGTARQSQRITRQL